LSKNQGIWWQLSYISVKTLIKKPPLFFTGRKLHPLGIFVRGWVEPMTQTPTIPPSPHCGPLSRPLPLIMCGPHTASTHFVRYR